MLTNFNGNEKSSGIYKLTNLHNGKIYIGQTKCFEDRFRTHKRLLRQKKHHNFYLQNDYNKCKIFLHHENFMIFEILEIVNDFSKLSERENEKIDEYYDKQKQCYNIQKNCNVHYSNFSKTKEETIEKWKATIKQSKLNDPFRWEKLRRKALRRLHRPEIKEKQRISLKKYYATPEGNAKIRENSKSSRTPEKLQKLHEHTRKLWKDPVWRAKMIKIRQNVLCSKTVQDKIFISIRERNKFSYPSFISPTGIVYPSGQYLYDFCKEHNLSLFQMKKLMYGKIKKRHHKGWKLTNNITCLPENYFELTELGIIDKNSHPSFTSPDGIIYPSGKNIYEFTKKHGLFSRLLKRLYIVEQGKKLLSNHKGWTLTNNIVCITNKYDEILSKPSEIIASHPSFTDQNGTIYPAGKSLCSFCKKHKLDRRNMKKLFRPSSPNLLANSYKGWTLTNKIICVTNEFLSDSFAK